jgi:hypothetical protein
MRAVIRRPRPVSPLVATLARIVRAIEERERLEAAERRRRITVVSGGKDGGRAT